MARQRKASVRIEFISKGFHDVLMSSGVGGEVERVASEIASDATSSARPTPMSEDGEQDPPRYEATDARAGSYGGGRMIAYARAANAAARYDEATNRTLTRAAFRRR